MASSTIPSGAHGDPTRRDFLMVATGAMAAVGAIATVVLGVWPQPLLDLASTAAASGFVR